MRARPGSSADRERRDETAKRFFEAMVNGDIDGLVGVLAHDVSVYGDGGGKAPQWFVPIVGVDRVAKLFAGLGRQMLEHGLNLEPREINGQPGVFVRTPAGNITNLFVLDFVDGLVNTVRGVTNPDKLRHLGPIADVRALAREARAGTS